MSVNNKSNNKSGVYFMLSTISLIALNVISPAALAASPLTPPSGSTPAAATSRQNAVNNSLIDLSSVFSANTSVMQTIFTQPDSALTVTPLSTNHSLSNEFSVANNVNLLANQNAANMVTGMLDKFHSNYTEQSTMGMGAPVDASGVTSDSILAADTTTLRPVYDGTSVKMVSTKYNANDAKLNLAALISQDYINTGPTKGLTQQQLIAQGDAVCTSLSYTLVDPKQSLSDGLDSGSLTKIAKDPALTQALLQDNWSKPKDPSANTVANANDPNAAKTSDGSPVPDSSISLKQSGMYEAYGKPFWGEFISAYHQITAAKTIGYATVYSLCMERAPLLFKDATGKETVESSIQHMHDTTNIINDPNYIKTIKSQSLNANVQEMIKAQRQTIQMLGVLHKDNESIEANLAVNTLMSASSAASSLGSMASGDVNREMAAIINNK